jgi:hypothetical protein
MVGPKSDLSPQCSHSHQYASIKGPQLIGLRSWVERQASVVQKETQRNAPRREILSGTPPACVRPPPAPPPNRRGLKRAQPQTTTYSAT